MAGYALSDETYQPKPLKPVVEQPKVNSLDFKNDTNKETSK